MLSGSSQKERTFKLQIHRTLSIEVSYRLLHLNPYTRSEHHHCANDGSFLTISLFFFCYFSGLSYILCLFTVCCFLSERALAAVLKSVETQHSISRPGTEVLGARITELCAYLYAASRYLLAGFVGAASSRDCA